MMSMSVWSKIESFFKDAEVRVSADLKKMLTSDQAKAFVSGAEQALESAVGVIARNAVSAAEAAGGTGAAKASAALAAIVAGAATEGVKLVESEGRLFMELAVSELKGLFAVTTPAPNPAEPAE